MRYTSVAAADRIYATAESCSMELVLVEGAAVKRFDELYRGLQRALGEARSDEYWLRGLSWLRKSRFNLLATPLPASHPRIGLLTAVAVSREFYSNCGLIYPQHAEAISSVCDAAMDVLLENGDAVTEAIVGAVTQRELAGRVAVLLPPQSFGFEDPVSQHLRGTPALSRIDVLRPAQLETKKPYDALFVVGRSSWYDSRGCGWVLAAPHARRILLTCYEWAFDRVVARGRAFSKSRVAVRSVPEVALDVPISAGEPETYEMEIDWDLLSGELPARAGRDDPAQSCDAHLLLLADGRVAFVGAWEDSRLQVLDPDAPLGKRVGSVALRDVRPGTFVLLRSEGGGELIVSVADRLLGADAERLRGMQARWKMRLREELADRDVAGVVNQLKRLGSGRANRGNLMTWISPRSLRTADEADFFAVMRLVGLQDQERMYWNAMGMLDQAHRRAGFRIRDQLEEEVERADLAELESVGWLDFTLPDGGGALTAFRVEDISPQTYRVPYQQVGEPFRTSL